MRRTSGMRRSGKIILTSVGLAILGLSGFYFLRRRKKLKQEASDTETTKPIAQKFTGKSVDALKSASVMSLGKVNTISSPLNLREKPSTSSAIITQIPKGGLVEILNNSLPPTEWFAVRVNNINGYVAKKYISIMAMPIKK